MDRVRTDRSQLHLLTVVLAGCAICVLAGGSFGLALACGSGDEDVCGAVLAFGWPPTMLLVAVIGVGALVTTSKRSYIPLWGLSRFLGIMGLWFFGAAFQNVVPHVVLIRGLTLVIDCALLYVAWRLILRRNTSAAR